MIIGRLRLQFKSENSNFRIKRSSIFLVNQIYELEPCLEISLEIATQSGQEFSLKNSQYKMTARKCLGLIHLLVLLLGNFGRFDSGRILIRLVIS